MKKSDIENITKEISAPILENFKFDLVDVEFVKEGPHMYLRIYIDKPEGITIEDCQRASEKISDKLDEIDPIEDNYFLEVSSPGLDRPLKNDKDLKSNINNDVDISLYKAVSGKKKRSGRLISYDDNEIVIIDEEVGELTIDRKLISKINLAVKF